MAPDENHGDATASRTPQSAHRAVCLFDFEMDRAHGFGSGLCVTTLRPTSIGEPFWRMATREQPQAWLCARHNGEPIPWFQAVEAVWNGDILPDNISVDIEVVDKGVPDAATR